MKEPSPLEAAWDTRWTQLAGRVNPPEREWRFAPPRRWRFDRAWPDEKVAVELEGGIFNKGRHVRPIGFEQDCAKYNQAALRGWRVFRFTSHMLDNDPLACVELVLKALEE